MLFCSREFLLFFALVLAVYWAMPWRRGRVWLLLVASFYFYAAWNRWLAVLIVGSSLADYMLARLMDAIADPRRRRVLLGVSLVGNLGLLVYFKYANFFLPFVGRTLHAGGCDGLAAGAPGDPAGRHLVLHVRGDQLHGRRLSPQGARRARTWRTSCCSSLFFPHLVAGPIVRARDFLPQIRRRKRLGLGAAAARRCSIFLMGLFKKLAIADRMAAVRRSGLRRSRRLRHRRAIWLGRAGLRLQIYCDFSGYTDMALGAAHMLGYKLAANFNMPYLAQRLRVLAALAHLAVELAARLPVHSAGRQPRHVRADRSQPADDDDARRPVARRELDVRGLGNAARRSARDRIGRFAVLRTSSQARTIA